MKGYIKTQSISDVITNSSSELFTVKQKEGYTTVGEIEALIEEQATKFHRRDQARVEQLYDEYNEKRLKAIRAGIEPNKLEIKAPWEYIIEEHLESSSGMGGEIRVWDIHSDYENRYYPHKHMTYEEYVDMIAKEENTTVADIESRIYIDIDHSRYATIEWIKENFEIIEEDPC